MGSLKQEEELEESKQEAILYVNGVRRLLPDGLAHLTLLEYLRGTPTISSFCNPMFVGVLFCFFLMGQVRRTSINHLSPSG